VARTVAPLRRALAKHAVGRGHAAAIFGMTLAVWQGACSRCTNDALPNTAITTSDAAAPVLSGNDSAETPVARPESSPTPVCGDTERVFLFSSPERPTRDQPLRTLAIADRRLRGSLSVSVGATRIAETQEPHGGPPYFWLLRVDTPSAGKARISFNADTACGGATLADNEVTVADRAAATSLPAPRTALWATRREWSPSFENLYSAWIEYLFDAPVDTQPSWSALQEVLADRSRNLLFNHMGASEDEQGTVIRPDCADLPYFLRAYFSFKLGLPFGWSRCTRGENGSAPRCCCPSTSEDPFPPVDGGAQALPLWADPERPHVGPWENNVRRLGELFRTTLADAVQSGAGRTPAVDDDGDYYPVTLSVDTLRPGTVFADPYGHVLVLAERIAQTPSSAGALFAVDGQPDGTVARKRFWRGNFLFAVDPALGSAGFKRFRPIVRDRASGHLRAANNVELSDYSPTVQYASGVEGFYDQVEDVLSPAPLDPMQALLGTVEALEEQVKARVTSVDNGRKFLGRRGPPAEMPDGEKIFETTGDWEDYSTPSRDLRLLIAIDVARGFPARVTRRPERFAMPSRKSADRVFGELQDRLARELHDRQLRYTRSDGSDWKLSLSDVVDREVSLEMAYNPNDCVELRWGAAPASDEASTCRQHAPAEQVAKMQSYRAWFHERRRPPR